MADSAIARFGGWLASRFGEPQNVTTNLNADSLVKVLGLSATSSTGMAVSEEAALRVSTVYACVNLIAGNIASLPFAVYQRDPREKVDHEYKWLFNEQAAPGWNALDAWTYIISSKLLYGDGYAELIRANNSPRVVGWKPLHPESVQPIKDGDRKVYRVNDDGQQRVLDESDVIQLTSLGYDGERSPSPITYAAKEAVGIALAAEQFQGRFFSNGATFDYALKTAGTIKKDDLEALRASLAARSQASRSPLILTGGLEPTQLSVNPRDAEVLATRLFSIEEICRIFGVPPHMVAHVEKTTSWGTGIEQQSIGFVRFTLQRHLTQISQEFNRKLWPNRERYFVEHVTDALVRGDLQARNQAFRIALGRAGEPGWMTVNEVRRLENLPPIDGGDELNNGGVNAQPTDTATRGQP